MTGLAMQHHARAPHDTCGDACEKARLCDEAGVSLSEERRPPATRVPAADVRFLLVCAPSIRQDRQTP